jgi:hypothetical protein
MKLLYLVIMLMLTIIPNAKTKIIKIVDATGEPFPKVLIIVKSLDGEGEVARYLTDQDGRTPEIQLGSGLYRVIATCPYGLCRTLVREFLGSDILSELTLQVSVNPTDLYGETVGGTRVRLMLETPHVKVDGVHILVRDPEAKWEKWYVADAEGSAEVELPTDPAVIVVIYGSKVFTQQVSARSANQDQKGKLQDTHPSRLHRTIVLKLTGT